MGQIVYRGNDLEEIYTQIKEDQGEEVSILKANHLDNGLIEVIVSNQQSIVKKDNGNIIALQYEKMLQSIGFNIDFLEDIKRRSMYYQGDYQKSIESFLRDNIQFSFSATSPSNTHIFIGEPGTGKTLASFSLARVFSRKFNFKVAFILVDFNLEILPYKTSLNDSLISFYYFTAKDSNLSAVKEHIAKLSAEYDIVVIDTAGYSLRQKSSFFNLYKLINTPLNWQVLCILPTWVSNDYLINIYRDYSLMVDQQAFCLSGVDRGGKIANSLNLLCNDKNQVALIASSYSAPDWIEPASAKRLAWMLLNEIKD